MNPRTVLIIAVFLIGAAFVLGEDQLDARNHPQSSPVYPNNQHDTAGPHRSLKSSSSGSGSGSSGSGSSGSEDSESVVEPTETPEAAATPSNSLAKLINNTSEKSMGLILGIAFGLSICTIVVLLAISARFKNG